MSTIIIKHKAIPKFNVANDSKSYVTFLFSCLNNCDRMATPTTSASYYIPSPQAAVTRALPPFV